MYINLKKQKSGCINTTSLDIMNLIIDLIAAEFEGQINHLFLMHPVDTRRKRGCCRHRDENSCLVPIHEKLLLT